MGYARIAWPDVDSDLEPPSDHNAIVKHRVHRSRTRPHTRTRTRTRARRDRPFRFLDLPKDIRLMCYEFLPEKITHHFTPAPDCTVAVADHCFNPAILSTCRLIHDEAREILHNAVRHDGPRISLAYRGPDIEPLLVILENELLSREPPKKFYTKGMKYGHGRHIVERCLQFDTQRFALRSYMRTPKDHEIHVNWLPVDQGMPEPHYLARFIKGMSRLYCLTINRPYTVSILEEDILVPLEDFMMSRIVGFSPEFHARLALDGLMTWMDILHRSSGARKTARYLWPYEL